MPLLLIGMMRPVPRRDDLLALRRVVDDGTRLQLTGLTGTAAADLVAALAGGEPDDELLRLADDAAGNPLYITELVGALTRSSQVRITDTGVRSRHRLGRWHEEIRTPMTFLTGGRPAVERRAREIGRAAGRRAPGSENETRTHDLRIMSPPL